jgi:hypothetical protein
MLYQIIKSLYAITSKARDSIELNALRFEFRHDEVDIVSTDGRYGVVLTLLTDPVALDGQCFTIAGGEIENKLLPALKAEPDAPFCFMPDGAGGLSVLVGFSVASLLHAGPTKLDNWRAGFALETAEPVAEVLPFAPVVLTAVLGAFKPFIIKHAVIDFTPCGGKRGAVWTVPERCFNEEYKPHITALQAVLMPCKV